MDKLDARVAKWDNAKAILIFLVVFGHSISPYISESQFTRSTSIFITFFHMPLFMFLTGLFSKGFVNAPKLNTKKVASYILLYYFMKLLIFITLGVVQGQSSFYWTSEKGTPWYIFVTAVFMVLTYLLKGYNSKKVFALILTVSLAVGYINQVGDGLVLSRIATFYPYFFLGYMTDRDRLLSFVNKKSIRLCSCFALALFIAAVFLAGDRIYNIRIVLTGNNPYAEFGRWASFGAFLRLGWYAVSSVVGIAVLSLVPNCRIPLLTGIGAKTLNIYALHRPILYVFQYTLMIPIMNNMPEYGVLAVLLGASAVITWVLSLKPFDYVLYPCTKCEKWLAPAVRWFRK